MNLKSTSIVVDLYCNTCGHKGMIVFLFVVTDKIIASRARFFSSFLLITKVIIKGKPEEGGKENAREKLPLQVRSTYHVQTLFYLFSFLHVNRNI